ncbi:hypothetical protein SAICODRAFT_39018, partial [Saitoella complicata NRRL Y-17804]
KRLIWHGSIPLKITLSKTESRIWDQTTPYYIEIPRISYLPVYLDLLIGFFRTFLLDESTASAGNAWFSTAEDAIPVRWHLPIGLLHDLHRPPPPASSSTTPQPWHLVLHFTNYPDILARRQCDWAMRDAYMNKLKEADFLRCGSAKRVMSLSKHDSDALWQSVVDHDLDTFTRITSTLLPTTPRNLPIRIYLPTPAPAPPSSPTTPTPSNPHPSSKPPTASVGPPLNTVHQPLTPLSQSQTLNDLLSSHFPALFPDPAKSKSTLQRQRERERSNGKVLGRAMIHGVKIPGEMPLVEVVREMAGADGWVDIVV